jgi:DNA-binding protein Fis
MGTVNVKTESTEAVSSETQVLATAINDIVSGKPVVLRSSLALIERMLIQRALEYHRFDHSEAATMCGLSEARLRHRLRKYGLVGVMDGED